MSIIHCSKATRGDSAPVGLCGKGEGSSMRAGGSDREGDRGVIRGVKERTWLQHGELGDGDSGTEDLQGDRLACTAQERISRLPCPSSWNGDDYAECPSGDESVDSPLPREAGRGRFGNHLTIGFGPITQLAYSAVRTRGNPLQHPAYRANPRRDSVSRRKRLELFIRGLRDYFILTNLANSTYQGQLFAMWKGRLYASRSNTGRARQSSWHYRFEITH